MFGGRDGRRKFSARSDLMPVDHDFLNAIADMKNATYPRNASLSLGWAPRDRLQEGIR